MFYNTLQPHYERCNFTCLINGRYNQLTQAICVFEYRVAGENESAFAMALKLRYDTLDHLKVPPRQRQRLMNLARLLKLVGLHKRRQFTELGR